MPGYKIVSSDDHVFEPADLWTARAERKFRDRAPSIVRKEGGDWWYCDNQLLLSVAPATQVGLRFERPDDITTGAATFDQVHPGAYIPGESVRDADADGVDVRVVYPTVGLVLYSKVPDSELLTSIFRTYNDWIVEFCDAFPDRLKGICMLNVDDVASAVGELERCAKMGLVGGMISVYPAQGRGYHLPDYEPLWAAAQDLEMPLSMHIATNRPGPGQEEQRSSGGGSFHTNIDHWVRMSLTDIVLSGVFERHPKLKVGAVEMELSWIPHFLDRIDYTYTQRPYVRKYQFNEPMLPSDYVRRNVFYSFQEDALGIRLRDIIGVNNLLWGSDYPHPESTFPRSRQILEEILGDCTEDEKAKISGRNADRIYHLD